MARLRDNDSGLLWDRLTGEGFDRKPHTPRTIKLPAYRPPMPESMWRPPTEPLNLTNAHRIAVDVETRGLDPRRGAQIVGIAIGIDGGPRHYYPFRHPEDNCEWDVLQWARDILNQYSGEIVNTKIDFDLDMLAHEGITFPHVKAFHDIAVAEPLLDEWRLRYGLDALAKDYLSEGKDESLLRQWVEAMGYADSKEYIHEAPARYVGAYAEADVDRPLRIFPMQLKRLEDEKLTTIYDIERRLIPVLLAMRRRGVRVDIQRAEEVRSKLVIERDNRLAQLKRIAGSGAELRAPDSFAAALSERGLHYPLTPETGKASITKGWLETHAGDELVDAIQAGRRVDTIINTFIDGHILSHAIDGRIHCQWNQLKGDNGGTIARLSSSDPNLQNLPARDEELGPLIRSIFVPEQDEDWHRIDLSQIEYRYLTHFAVGIGAEEARKRYRDDPETDFHKLCGNFMGADASNSFIRKRVKGTNFCRIYGGGIRKLALVIGCSIEEAEAFDKKYSHALPFVDTTLKAAMHWAERRGFVETVIGRRQRFLLWEPSGRQGNIQPLRYEAAREAYGPHLQRAWLYAALNRKLQGSAADHIKKTMVDCWDAGIQNVLGSFLVTVHDEQGSSVPRTPEGNEAVAEVKRIMETCITLKVPVIADASRGPNWGAC